MTSIEEFSAEEGITAIDEHMLDKQKFYPLILTSSLLMRGMMHPFNFVRVRQQVQASKSLYNGTFDALKKVRQTEGIRAFAKGGLVNCLQIIPSFSYINILENTKSYLKQNQILKNSVGIEFAAGFTASLLNSAVSVPFDIAYQNLIIDGQFSPEKETKNNKRIFIPPEAKQRPFGALRYVYNYIYQTEGVRGLWKGSFISIGYYSLNSGLWWSLYSFYRDLGVKTVPDTYPMFLIQAGAGAFAGNTCAVMINWLDVIRVSIQTEVDTGKGKENTCKGVKKIIQTGNQLWAEEGHRFMFKGLTARMLQTSCISPLMIAVYEFVKRTSLKEEYKTTVRR